MKYRKTTLLLALATALYLGLGEAQAREMNLDKAVKLIPQGWTVGEDVKFKKGTTVQLTEYGQVTQGVLGETTYLRPTGWKNLINDYYYMERISGVWHPRFFYPVGARFGAALPTYGHVRYKSGEQIVFDADGCVLEGVIDENITVTLKPGKYGFVKLRDGKLVSFYADGCLKAGTLDEDTKLRPAGWQEGYGGDEGAGFIEFKGGTQAEFNESGEVVQGTLNKAAAWKQPDGEVVQLAAKSTVRFANGTATLLADKNK